MATSALDPAVVAAVDDLQVVARHVVEGVRSGTHRSPFHGFSAEFSQHRAYRPGDDLKYLDWKLHARTDRLYTRQFHETTNMAAVIALDTSGSMAFPDTGVSKFRYGVVLTAALAYLIVSQGDSVGLMTSQGDSLVYVPAKSGQLHLRTILAKLARLEPAGAWQGERVISRATELLRRRGLLFVLSDFYDDETVVWREMARTAKRGHDVSALQILSRDEIEFPFRGAVEFEDLESRASRVVDAAAVGQGYRVAVAEFLSRVRQQALSAGLDYSFVTTDTPPDEALRRHLLRRGSSLVSHTEREKA
jgi:uncharacterized protein (DUF58 family)